MISVAVRPPRHDATRDERVWRMWTEGAMTQAQIGAALGITAQRVSAILTRYRDSLVTCPACGQEVQPDRWSAAELAELAKLPHVAGARGNPCASN